MLKRLRQGLAWLWRGLVTGRLPHDRGFLRRLDRLERRIGVMRDPRIPPRSLNYNQHQSPFWWRYVRDFTAEAAEREIPFLERACGLRPTSRVLDYGCGLGRSARAFSTYLTGAGAYWGADIVARASPSLSRPTRGTRRCTSAI
jgi:SAM-dependent methyltransferase